MSNQKGSLRVIIALVIGVVIIGGGYLIWNAQQTDIKLEGLENLEAETADDNTVGSLNTSTSNTDNSLNTQTDTTLPPVESSASTNSSGSSGGLVPPPPPPPPPGGF